MPTAMEVGLRRSTLPLPPLQPRRLLDIIERLPALEGGNPLRWLEGVTWEPWPCRGLDSEPDSDCNPEDFADDPAECEGWLTQIPWRLSDAMKRSTLDFTSLLIGDRLEARYNQHISAAFATSLIRNADTTISLSNAATAPTGSAFAASTTVDYGFQVLEQEIGARLRGGVGYIHCPPGMLAQFVYKCGVYLNGDHWETPAGNVVISDAGYVNPAPPSGQGASAETSDWVYASGPVFYESTAPTLLDPTFEGGTGGANDTTPWDRDTVVAWIAGYGILVFDPCPVTAVRISYT